MQPMTARFAAAVRTSHTPVVHCEVLHAGQVVATLDDVVIDGQVTSSSLQSVRSSFRATIVDPTGTLTPSGTESLLAPAGTEVRLSRGVEYIDGARELVPLGVFGLTDVQVDEGDDGAVSVGLEGLDRADRVKRNLIAEPVLIQQGTNVATAIRTLITTLDPAAVFSFQSTSATTPFLVIEGDGWEEARNLAAAAGLEVFVDPAGVYTLRRVPDVDQSTPVWLLHEGDDCTVTQIGRRLSNRDTPNRVVVLAQGSGLLEPILAEARDINPQSPTFVDGPYGVVTLAIRETRITSLQQARDMAAGELRSRKGASEQVQVQAVPNPALEVGDVVSVLRTPVRVDARYVIDSITTPVGSDGMQTLVMRERRV
jgi:hypothetical protein